MPSSKRQGCLLTVLVLATVVSTQSTAAGTSQEGSTEADPELSQTVSNTSTDDQLRPLSNTSADEHLLPLSNNHVDRTREKASSLDKRSQKNDPPGGKPNRNPDYRPPQPDHSNNPRQPNIYELPCRYQSRIHLVEPEGSVEWIQPVLEEDCRASWEWVLSVSATSGLVIDFSLTDMPPKGLILSVHEVEKYNIRPKFPPMWTSKDLAQISVVLPMFVPKNQLMIIVKTQRRQQPTKPPGDPKPDTTENDRPKPDSTSDRPKPDPTHESSTPSTMTDGPSRVNFSYAAHPLKSMPKEVHVDTDSLHGSRVMYNCSPSRDEIPRVLICDMIEQCVGGEDEAGCSYKDGGCGDHWVPYADHCLRAFFQPPTDFTPGSSHITMPVKAEEECQKRSKSRLATLPHEEGVQLVLSLLRRSGFSSVSVGLRKMRPLSSKMKHLYRFLYQWGQRGGPVAHEQTAIQRRNPVFDCAAFDISRKSFIIALPCDTASQKALVPDGFVCMTSNPTKRQTPNTRIKSHVAAHLKKLMEGLYLNAPLKKFPTKMCPDGSLVQTFHECSWDTFDLTPLSVEKSLFPRFGCTLGHNIHYSVVCDALDDCADGSDEINCKAPTIKILQEATFTCNNMQIIPVEKRCDAVIDCLDRSDEEDCSVCRGNTLLCPGVHCIPNAYRTYFASCRFQMSGEDVHSEFHNLYPPSVLELDGYGMSRVRRNEGVCEEGYFQCASGLCIPVFLVNNGELDCPSGTDEDIPLENFTCPGYYRCHKYGNCVHSRHLCDGIAHCPNHDDERYCDLNCPSYCECEGYAYKCSSMIDPRQHPKTRLLDISGVISPNLAGIQIIGRLMFLNLSSCQLRDVKLTRMPQLEVLDLSYNQLSDLSSLVFDHLTGLKRLSLANNPFTPRLDASFTRFVRSCGLENLVVFSLKNTGLYSIDGRALSSLHKLVTLDISGNPVARFDKDVFHGLTEMKIVYADNYKLCCPHFHYRAVPDCHAPLDELSSCSDLLSGYFFQVSVWVLAALNIPANIGCMVYRFLETRRGPKTYAVLVANLCLSDLLMGVYLIFIGSADVAYRDDWVWREEEWTVGPLCTATGILAFLSSEVSAFVVCLITLDRLLVICFPLKVGVHMTTRSTLLACGAVWLLGLLLAVCPLMAGWNFYGQNGFCLPLPITRNKFLGQKYAFAVFIIFNFILFLLIGAGQVMIYRSIKKARKTSRSGKHLQDTSIALKLMLVVVTDFLCWFPIGLMGLLASLCGVAIPGAVNVWAALFILPFNSALNPHLYTLNTLINRYREQRSERRIQNTISKIDVEIADWPPDKVEKLLESCLRSRVVRKEKVLRWLSDGKDGHENGAYLHDVPLHNLATADSVHTST